MLTQQNLKKKAMSWGADFFGVADLKPLNRLKTLPSDLLAPYTRGISLGVALSRDVFENLSDGPTPHYSQHYLAANQLLDQAALRVSSVLQKEGARALPVPASQVLDRGEW